MASARICSFCAFNTAGYRVVSIESSRETRQYNCVICNKPVAGVIIITVVKDDKELTK